MADNDDDMSNVAIGPIESGRPMPRADGFIGRLRRTLERLEVGMSVEVKNVSLKQEKYIRARLPQIGREMKQKHSVRVGSNKRDRSVKRTLFIWRIE